jgi:hypothetical protein
LINSPTRYSLPRTVPTRNRMSARSAGPWSGMSHVGHSTPPRTRTFSTCSRQQSVDHVNEWPSSSSAAGTPSRLPAARPSAIENAGSTAATRGAAGSQSANPSVSNCRSPSHVSGVVAAGGFNRRLVNLPAPGEAVGSTPGCKRSGSCPRERRHDRCIHDNRSARIHRVHRTFDASLVGASLDAVYQRRALLALASIHAALVGASPTCAPRRRDARHSATLFAANACRPRSHDISYKCLA